MSFSVTDLSIHSEHFHRLMKRIWTLLVLLTFVSGSFERNVPVKNGTSHAIALPEADQVEAKGLTAAGARKQDPKVELFHAVMVGVIIVGSVIMICAAVIKALRAPKDKDDKSLSEDCPAVQKHPGIKDTEEAILVKCQEEV